MISSLGKMVFGIKPKIKGAARFLGEDRHMIVKYQAGNWTYSGDERHAENQADFSCLRHLSVFLHDFSVLPGSVRSVSAARAMMTAASAQWAI